MKKIVYLIAAYSIAALVFAAGYYHCFIQMLRYAGYYIDGEMIVVDFMGEYNEVCAGDWNDLLDKYAQG